MERAQPFVPPAKQSQDKQAEYRLALGNKASSRFLNEYTKKVEETAATRETMYYICEGLDMKCEKPTRTYLCFPCIA